MLLKYNNSIMKYEKSGFEGMLDSALVPQEENSRAPRVDADNHGNGKRFLGCARHFACGLPPHQAKIRLLRIPGSDAHSRLNLLIPSDSSDHVCLEGPRPATPDTRRCLQTLAGCRLPMSATYAIITTCPVCLGVNQERIQCNCANDSISAHWCAQAALLPCGGD